MLEIPSLPPIFGIYNPSIAEFSARSANASLLLQKEARVLPPLSYATTRVFSDYMFTVKHIKHKQPPADKHPPDLR